jgi:hypothetical protein
VVGTASLQTLKNNKHATHVWLSLSIPAVKKLHEATLFFSNKGKYVLTNHFGLTSLSLSAYWLLIGTCCAFLCEQLRQEV